MHAMKNGATMQHSFKYKTKLGDIANIFAKLWEADHRRAIINVVQYHKDYGELTDLYRIRRGNEHQAEES